MSLVYLSKVKKAGYVGFYFSQQVGHNVAEIDYPSGSA